MNETAIFLFMFWPFLSEEAPEKYAPLPPPNKEVVMLISDLGDKKFKKRESAEARLRELGWTALRAISEARKHKDAEIAHRAKKIYNEYFRIEREKYSDKLPSIWRLPNSIRYNKKDFNINKDVEKIKNVSLCKPLKLDDLSLHYYRRAAAKMERQIESPYGATYYRLEDIEQEATDLYLTDLLLSGKSREEVNKLAKEMLDNSGKCENFHINHGGLEDQPQWYASPPGPLVDREEYVDPNTIYQQH